jgi:hypothetical protein
LPGFVAVAILTRREDLLGSVLVVSGDQHHEAAGSGTARALVHDQMRIVVRRRPDGRR